MEKIMYNLLGKINEENRNIAESIISGCDKDGLAIYYDRLERNRRKLYDLDNDPELSLAKSNSLITDELYKQIRSDFDLLDFAIKTMLTLPEVLRKVG